MYLAMERSVMENNIKWSIPAGVARSLRAGNQNTHEYVKLIGYWQQRLILTPVCSEWVLQPIREWGHLSVDASQRSPGPQRLLYALLLLAPRHRRLLPVTRGEDTPALDTPESSRQEWAERFGGFSVVFRMFKPANKERPGYFGCSQSAATVLEFQAGSCALCCFHGNLTPTASKEQAGCQ